ncbi:RNA methyltransferase [Salmonella enterica subsp. enterica]|uniref:RNA methyltransferase n=1 Tax=Salmonella enterica I TaxID=59201 RepID=A0A379WD17_SALET|nr:RNA methyltransferase [Salmonella enterica subsp. enterica]
MLRFVLRSETKLTQLRAALPWLRAQLPQLRVITANIQPVHMAIMEGETEIYLTDQQALAERFNDVPLWIRPQSFFQTNPTVASRLYATARDWGRATAGTPYVGSFLRSGRIRPALRDAADAINRY